MATDAGLNLVEVSPNSNPPVCKIFDYKKYLYSIQRKKKQSVQKTSILKEVRLRPVISEHDLKFKIKQISKFIEKGNKVKITMFFKGREIEYPSTGKKVFNTIIEELKNSTRIEKDLKFEGRNMILFLAPLKSSDRREKNGKEKSSSINI